MSFSTSLPLLLVLLPHSSSTGLFVSWIEGVQQPARVLLWGRIFLRDSGGASARLGQRNANNRLARIMAVWFWAAVEKKKWKGVGLLSRKPRRSLLIPERLACFFRCRVLKCCGNMLGLSASLRPRLVMSRMFLDPPFQLPSLLTPTLMCSPFSSASSPPTLLRTFLSCCLEVEQSSR